MEETTRQLHVGGTDLRERGTKRRRSPRALGFHITKPQTEVVVAPLYVVSDVSSDAKTLFDVLTGHSQTGGGKDRGRERTDPSSVPVDSMDSMDVKSSGTTGLRRRRPG